jgi:hypothetical protein
MNCRRIGQSRPQQASMFYGGESGRVRRQQQFLPNFSPFSLDCQGLVECQESIPTFCRPFPNAHQKATIDRDFKYFRVPPTWRTTPLSGLRAWQARGVAGEASRGHLPSPS